MLVLLSHLETMIMSIDNTLQADILDILFANRNKSYGAYQLRKTYNKRLSIALLTMIMACSIFSIAYSWQNKQYNQTTIDMVGPDIVLDNANAHPKEEVIEPPHQRKSAQQQPLHIATIKVTAPKIVDDKLVTEPPATQDAMNGQKIDVTTTSGNRSDAVNPPVEGGTGSEEKLIKEEDYSKLFYTVQQEARFPGGLIAWTDYLQRNLRSELPTYNGAPVGSYTVIVSFLVDKEGNVSEVKAENDPGYGTAAEAMRAIQHSKSWLPAMQNGHAVLYRQKQTITFIVSENQ